MEIFIDDSEHPPTSAEPLELLLTPEPTVLRIAVPAGEELASASITWHRYTGSETPPFSAPSLETDTGSFTGVSWVKADWGSARALRTFDLQIVNPSNLRVRVQIARGGGGWFSPPGPHTFDVADGASATLQGSFPDTVADRVMLEFLARTSGAPTPVTLSPLSGSDDPLHLTFGRHARDIALRVATRRDFFTHAGELPAGEADDAIVLPDLLETLRSETDDVFTDTEIAIEISAAVAGFAVIEWSFAHTTILRQFSDDSDTRSLTLSWGEPVFEPFTLQPPGRPETFELALASEPVRERVALAPDITDPLGEAEAVLCRPLYDNAQPLSLELEQPIVGVDLWARPLTARIALTIDVRGDDGGRPASTPGQESIARIEIDDPDAIARGPAYIAVDFEAPASPPVEAPGDRFWLVVRVDEGELLWYSSAARPAAAGTPRYRLSGGDWLQRTRAGDNEASIWAVTRLRVVDTGPPPPIESSLILVEADDTRTTYPLTADTAGVVRWSAADADDPVPQAVRMDLRLSPVVAGTMTLSSLRITYRESANS